MSHSSVTAEQIAATRIRRGHRSDLPAIHRLIERANSADGLPRVNNAELEAVTDRGQLIVLEIGATEISAVAWIAAGRGLAFLVLDPAIASLELEQRMIAVANALCEAQQPGLSTSCGRGKRRR